MKRILPFLAIAVLMAACGTPPMPASIAQRVDIASAVVSDIQILDAGMAAGEGPGAHREAQIRLLNRHSRDLSLRYRYRWYNAKGMEIKAAASPWREIRLSADENRELRSVAPTPDCVDFRVSFAK